MCAPLSACGQNGGNDAVDMIETIKEYETMFYGNVKEKTGNEAVFYHADLLIGEIPDSSVCVVYLGEYDEELAGAALKDDDMPFRIEGALGDLMTDIKEEMSLTEREKLCQVSSASCIYKLSIKFPS